MGSGSKTRTRSHTSRAHRGAAPRPASPRSRILRSQDRFWRPGDLPGPTSTAQHLLADLVDQGELRHVRKGLYWRGTRTPLGMSPPPVKALVGELTGGPGVGPAGNSAANLLQLSTQVPRDAEIAVPFRAPRPVGPVKFVSRAARTGRRTERLNELEVAFLEVLEGWDRVVEVPPADAWRRLSGLLGSGAVRADRLARAARTEPASVRARLSALLRGCGHRDQAELVPDVDRRARAHTAGRELAGVA